MAWYREKRYTTWPDPQDVIEKIREAFENGLHSVEFTYGEEDNSLILRIWEDPPYDIGSHNKTPDID